MTSHRRMTWGLFLVSVLTLGGSLAIIASLLDGYQERELDRDLMQIARQEAQEAPGNNFTFSSRPGPARNDVGPLEKYGVIFDERGQVLSATQPFDATPPQIADLDAAPGVPLDFAYGGRRYRGVVVAIPGFEGRRLLLAASRAELDGDSRFVRKAMGTAFGVSVIWLFVAIGWLTRRNMREHERIAGTLRRIATGDMKARVADEVSDLELRRVGSDVDEIAERLATLVQHQRRFIAHAAHELRSPLTALHGELQQALRKERTAAEYRESLTFCLRASHRLKHLTDDLLELARAEQTAKLAEAVSLDAALTDVVESLAPLAHEKNVDVQRGATDACVLARRSEVERILRNLLDNAIRHSPNGGTVRLEVSSGPMVVVRVRDQGPGVPVEERERIFEPFHRSGPARVEARGAGLGLSIARELARKYGGDTIADESGDGFVLSLPPALPTEALADPPDRKGGHDAA